MFTVSQSLVKGLWPTNEQLPILPQQFPSSVSLSKLFSQVGNSILLTVAWSLVSFWMFDDEKGRTNHMFGFFLLFGTLQLKSRRVGDSCWIFTKLQCEDRLLFFAEISGQSAKIQRRNVFALGRALMTFLQMQALSAHVLKSQMKSLNLSVPSVILQKDPCIPFFVL